MLEFFPCSLSCLNAFKLSRFLIAMARDALPENVFEAGRAAAQMPLLILNDYLVAFEDSKFDRGKLVLELSSAKKSKISELGLSSTGSFSTPQLVGFSHICDQLAIENGFAKVDLTGAQFGKETLNCAIC